jgi:hypothetical protein
MSIEGDDRRRVNELIVCVIAAVKRIGALEALGTKLGGTHYDVHNKLADRIDALEASADNVNDRLNALEAAYGAFGKHNDVHNALNVRLETLEALVRDSDSSAFDAVVKRIDALEAHHMTTLAELTPKLVAAHIDVERERQARWNAAYNAALPEAMRVCRDESAGTKRLLDDVHELCTMHAGRAHGPLEAVPTGEVEAFKRGRETLDEKVNALVAAAGDAAEVMREEGLTFTAGELDAARKPFETRQASEVQLCTCEWTKQPDGSLKSTATCELHRINVMRPPDLEPKPKPISGAEFVDGMEEAISQRNAEVEALVKAALRVRADYAGAAGVSLASAAAMELAIKPFLRVKP